MLGTTTIAIGNACSLFRKLLEFGSSFKNITPLFGFLNEAVVLHSIEKLFITYFHYAVFTHSSFADSKGVNEVKLLGIV